MKNKCVIYAPVETYSGYGANARDKVKALNGTCYVCTRNLRIDNFEAGHIISEANGGIIHIDNLKPLCKPCNTSCATDNLDEFKRKFEISNKIEDKNIYKITSNSDKVSFIKNNSTYRVSVKFGDEDRKFNDLCIMISEVESKWNEWYNLYLSANGRKILLDISGMSIGYRAFNKYYDDGLPTQLQSIGFSHLMPSTKIKF